ncbi:HdeD family acid-resistance protein [Stakelama sediminis]|uniref:Uncharacterized membrane protein HdeD (DUF308 family) n=1 Tax=Stakelama sediminis TaxID=463200 RepID=A0A840YYQ3_9SPHN|nr:DUF308 domain-containing protein [Stakelama sediminis]MBB5718921.1 uncharacterized membrane protein HdeD (DUF308 family) [Stakelama sediminis]
MEDFERMTTELAPAGRGWHWMLGYGIVSVIIGLLALLAPVAATLASALVVGIFLILAGVSALLMAFAARGHETNGYAVLFGILSLIIGILIWWAPAAGAFSLTLLIVTWLVLRGGLEIAWSMKLQRHRTWMFVLGLINLLLALLVIFTLPLSALTLPGYILGISFLITGINAIVWALSHRKPA